MSPLWTSNLSGSLSKLTIWSFTVLVLNLEQDKGRCREVRINNVTSRLMYRTGRNNLRWTHGPWLESMNICKRKRKLVRIHPTGQNVSNPHRLGPESRCRILNFNSSQRSCPSIRELVRFRLYFVPLSISTLEVTVRWGFWKPDGNVVSLHTSRVNTWMTRSVIAFQYWFEISTVRIKDLIYNR